MTVATKPRPATYADLEAVPPHLVAEIVGGILETHPRPAPRHAGVKGQLSYELIGPFDRARGGPGGWIFLHEPELHLGADVLVPDLAGWRRKRLQEVPDAPFMPVRPDWVCEIASPSTERLDRGPKRRIYAEAGVEYLWLIDSRARLMEAFARAGESWLLLATLGAGDEARVPPFDAVGFPFDDLFPFDAKSPPETLPGES
jgi:Uma2 family endonuclease